MCSSDLLYRADLDYMNGVAKADGNLAHLEMQRFKRNCAYIANLTRRSVLRLVEAMGAVGVDDSNPVQVAFADALAGAAHRALSWDVAGSNYAKAALGMGGPDDEIKKRQAASAAALKT